MKIRTEEDIKNLDARIKAELKVDVRKYKDEEVVEKIVALLVFPEYILTWMIGPVLIALALFVIGFFILHLVHIEYILYAILGFVLFLVSGLTAGLLLLTSKMKKDIESILDYSLTMTEAAVVDVNLVNQNISPKYKKEAYGLLFNGIIHIVTIPMTTKVISEKLPLLGRLVNRFVRRFFWLISDRVQFDNIELEKLGGVQTSNSSKSVERYSKSMSYASLGMSKLVGLSFGVVRFPIRILFWITAIMLLLFLWGVH